jgi:preprotein translocase subunit SecD
VGADVDLQGGKTLLQKVEQKKNGSRGRGRSLRRCEREASSSLGSQKVKQANIEPRVNVDVR